jgi:hypothetical protein
MNVEVADKRWGVEVGAVSPPPLLPYHPLLHLQGSVGSCPTITLRVIVK